MQHKATSSIGTPLDEILANVCTRVPTVSNETSTKSVELTEFQFSILVLPFAKFEFDENENKNFRFPISSKNDFRFLSDFVGK